MVERINEHENKSIEIAQTEKQRYKRMKKNSTEHPQSVRQYQMSNMYNLDTKRRKKEWNGRNIEEIMTRIAQKY